MSEDKRDWRLTVAVAIGAFILRALASTWRFRITNGDVIPALRARQQPFIFAFWHGTLLPLLWIHRGERVAIVISAHRDGEIVARIAERLGHRTIRGRSEEHTSELQSPC